MQHGLPLGLRMNLEARLEATTRARIQLTLEAEQLNARLRELKTQLRAAEELERKVAQALDPQNAGLVSSSGVLDLIPK